MPEGHEGREIYGVIKDEQPEKGRALARIEEKQGRTIDKSGRPSATPKPNADTSDSDPGIE